MGWSPFRHWLPRHLILWKNCHPEKNLQISWMPRWLIPATAVLLETCQQKSKFLKKGGGRKSLPGCSRNSESQNSQLVQRALPLYSLSSSPAPQPGVTFSSSKRKLTVLFPHAKCCQSAGSPLKPGQGEMNDSKSSAKWRMNCGLPDQLVPIRELRRVRCI